MSPLVSIPLRLSYHLQNLTLIIPNNCLPIRPINRDRPHKPPAIFLKPLNRFLCVLRALDNLADRVPRPAFFAGPAWISRNVLENIAQLVGCWRGGSDFELEFAAPDGCICGRGGGGCRL